MNKLINRINGIKNYETINTLCREFNNWIEYVIVPVSLNIDVKTYPDELKGEISDWQMYIGDQLFIGRGKRDLWFKFEHIIKAYCLTKKTKSSRKSIIIWVNNLRKIEGFFRQYITNMIKTRYIELCDVLEFRDIKCWNEELGDQGIDYWNDYILNILYKKIFIPDRYFYISINQIIRKKLMKSCPEEDKEKINDMFPLTYGEFTNLRKYLYGGLTYCGYTGTTFEDNMISYDLTAAYIYNLVACKFPMSRGKVVNKDNWKNYINNKVYGSIGTYDITFENYTTATHCYKDINGESPTNGLNNTTYKFNNLDLELFMSLVKIKKIECTFLMEFVLDYIPNFIRKILIEEYVKERSLPRDTEERRLQKVKVRGIYGDTIKKAVDKEHFENIKKSAVLTPYFGIWTTSYTKKFLLETARSIDGWRYSDTDSIYCKDTKINADIIEKFNCKQRSKLFKVCGIFGYDFDKIIGLGEFKVEHKIKKFKANAVKEYMFTTDENEFILKAAGFSQKYDKPDESYYDLNEIPLGKVLFTRVTADSYYEFWLRGEAARIMLETMDMMTTSSLLK